MTKFELLLLVLSLPLVTLFLVYLLSRVKSWMRKAAIKRRFKRGFRGESIARDYLKKHRYKILGEQVEVEGVMKIDGQSHSYKVRADLLAEKKGKTAFIEVKTGKKAIDPLSRATRRQLFEYVSLYDVDEALFFDAENKKLMEIEFPGLKGTPRKRASREIYYFIGGAFFSAVIIALMLLTFYFIK